MTSAVTAGPIKVELLEECGFVKKTDKLEEEEEEEEGKEEESEQISSSESGKNKPKPVLPKLVVADTELFVKTLSDVVSGVLSTQPELDAPSPKKSSNKATPSKVRVIGTRSRFSTRSGRLLGGNIVKTTETRPSTNPRPKRACYRTPSPSPVSASSSETPSISPPPSDIRKTSSEPNKSSSEPKKSDPRKPSPDPLNGESDQTSQSPSPTRLISSPPLSSSPSLNPNHSSPAHSSPGPSSRPTSTEPSVKERDLTGNRTVSPECHAESIRQSQLLSASQMKMDPAKDKELLDVHVNISSAHRQHTCINCGKVFSQRLHLQRHIKSVHEGIRDNLCAFCGKGFMLKSHLMEHIRAVHFKIKNHVCLFCDWKFNRVGDLNRHVKTVHTNGKKPRRRKAQADYETDNNLLNGSRGGDSKNTIDVVSDGSDHDFSRDSSFFDQPLSSNADSLSPLEQAPLSLTDRYLSDYKKRLRENEREAEEHSGAHAEGVSSTNGSLSPSEYIPLSLTDRYLSDYKKRLLELENDKESAKNGGSGSDLEIQEDEIVLFPSSG